VVVVTRVLVVNPGSSSLKLSLVHGTEIEHAETLQRWDGEDGPLSEVLQAWEPDAVGHRVVHGGDLEHHAVVDDDVEQHLADWATFAPDHQQQSIDAVAAVRRLRPDLEQVVCFDTVFHRTMPAAAATYAVPQRWRDLGVRRFGFHGLAHASAARQVEERLGVSAARRHVSCHLGSGASLCAILGGRSIDTTMGMTPLEGLVMGERSGTVDPAVVPWLVQQHGMDVADVDATLRHHSGLLALGGSPDVAALLDQPDRHAALAVDVYVHRVVAGVGAMVAALGGLDVLTFSGGVGENVPAVRQRVTDSLGHLGVAGGGDADAGPVLVLPADEEREIAAATLDLLAGRA
jgi:acetate kinase